MHNDSAQPPLPGSEADWDAIARFIAGESDPVESRSVQAWLDARPGDAALVDAVQRRASLAEQRARVSVDVEGALARVHARLDAHALESGAAPPSLTVADGGARVRRASPGGHAATPAARRGIRPWHVVALASAAALVLVVARQRGMTSPAAAEVFATAVGARDSVRLSDGTRVILAPGSRLAVAAGYGSTTRDVTLDGAAYFDVKHDEAHPFTVHAREAEIRDVGTAFSVKTDEAGVVSVAVTHGIVAVRAPSTAASAAVELRAGDRGVVRGTAVAVTRGTVTDEDVAWTRGQLAYRDAPMSEVQADMRRWYGIDLRLAGTELASRTLTASFRADSAADVIHVIALALGADVEQRGDTVILRMAGRSSSP